MSARLMQSQKIPCCDDTDKDSKDKYLIHSHVNLSVSKRTRAKRHDIFVTSFHISQTSLFKLI